MGRIEEKWVEMEARERVKLQTEIRLKFGMKAIHARQKELCGKCSAENCLLFPICSDGSDCPYFAP